MLLSWLLYSIIKNSLTKKDKGNSLGRPRIITLEQGTVSLEGFPTDIAVKLQNHIKSFSVEAEEIKDVGLLLMLAPILADTSLGLRFDIDTKSYQLVVVKYNPFTNEAQVESVKDVGSVKQLAQNAFKLELVKQGLI